MLFDIVHYIFFVRRFDLAQCLFIHRRFFISFFLFSLYSRFCRVAFTNGDAVFDSFFLGFHSLFHRRCHHLLLLHKIILYWNHLVLDKRELHGYRQKRWHTNGIVEFDYLGTHTLGLEVVKRWTIFIRYSVLLLQWNGFRFNYYMCN